MRLIRDLVPGYFDSRGAVVAVGNFDGVHLGHQAVIEQTRQRAGLENLAASVVCFEPMPREYFSRESAPPRLTRLRRKFRLIESRGIDQLACLRFNAAMAGMSAEAFIEKVLARALRAKCVIVGEDFRFGRQRAGDIALLKKYAGRHGFEVIAAKTVVLDGERVSSTRARAALAAGDLPLASRLLGSPYTLEGHVRHGEKIGRGIGFPTANVHTGQHPLPLRGVFAGRVRLADGRHRKGAVSIGTRPVLGNSGQEVMEVHLLDFDENIYGQRLEVALLKKLRDEASYKHLDELREQIEKDVAAVRAMTDV